MCACTHVVFLAPAAIPRLPRRDKNRNKFKTWRDAETEKSVWRRWWRGKRRRRSNGRAVMRCVSDAFSDGAVLAAAPVNHDYNGEERWEQWCRKSRSDNYNARDKIIGTRRTLPIISCISSRVTPTRSPQSPLLPSPTDNQQSRVIFVKSKKN